MPPNLADPYWNIYLSSADTGQFSEDIDLGAHGFVDTGLCFECIVQHEIEEADHTQDIEELLLCPGH